MKSIKKLLFVIVLVALIATAVTYFRDTTAPSATLTPDSGPISPRSELTLALADEGSGVKQLTVTLIQEQSRLPLIQQEFPTGTDNTTIPLNLADLNLREGSLQIEVVAGDHAVYNFGKGNVTEQTFQLTYDSRPPVIGVVSRAHNFTRGGSGLVTFTLDEAVTRVGVGFGERFFPAYEQSSGLYAAAVAFPYNVEPDDFVPRIIAVDAAGNERQAGIYYRANNRSFRQRQINVSDSFLNMTLPEFSHQTPEFDSPLEQYLYINRELRQQNRETVAALATDTAPEPLWDGAFLQLPRSSSHGLFADHRTYLYNGREIDRAVHLGHDLASTAQADIPVANHGRVVFAENLGIYGLCVVVDHGLGIQTLYAHLSHIGVAVGDSVRQGDILGRTGITGLAGGDHLHFEVLVGGLPVHPLEWWDGSWLANNIDSKLKR
mgnify:CR=1 FL=1